MDHQTCGSTATVAAGTMGLVCRWLVCTSILLALTRRLLVQAIPVDNGVVGEPTIECGADAIEVTFKTRNPFNGRLYVKGRYGQGDCQNEQIGRSFTGITLSFNTCSVQRLRSLNPKGIFASTTVVISFHSIFVTKVDRVYHVQCFYMESDKTVNQEIQVSDISTAFINHLVPMPVCRYEILEGGPSGTALQFAIVGQQVYHKWTCDTETQETFCMVVHTCFVDDAQGNNSVQMIDEKGCALDKYLLNNLEYPTDLAAGQEAHIFKYADKSSLFFQCQISITVKDSECPRPECEEPKRGKRQIEKRFFTLDQFTIDVSSQQINTIDYPMNDLSEKRETFPVLEIYSDRSIRLFNESRYCFRLVSIFIIISVYLAFVALSAQLFQSVFYVK